MTERGGTSQPVEIRQKEAAALRRYLLGDVSAKGQEEIELWLMSSEEAYDLLEAAEDDLIDDSLAGRLKGRDLTLFNDHFLAAPERKRKLQFGRSLRRAVAAAVPPAAIATPTFAASTFWARVFHNLRYRPAFASAAFALLIVTIAGSAWSVVRVARLQQELRSATDQLAGVARDRDDLKRQLDETQAFTRTLEAQFRVLEASTVSVKASSGPLLAVLSLMPGITRSSSDIPQVTLAPNTSLVRFSLALLDNDFPAYRVSLMDAESREVWVQNNVVAANTAGGKAVTLTIPAELLSDTDYSFNLSGTPSTGAPESIGRYYFRAVRQ